MSEKNITYVGLKISELQRTDGMVSDQALQAIYRSVVVTKLLFASSACWLLQQPISDESTPSSDGVRGVVSTRQICRCRPTIEQCVATDEKLFKDSLLSR